MALEKLLKILMAHPRFGPQIINKIAESWPVRKAAKFTAAFYLRGKHGIEEQIKKTNATQRANTSSESSEKKTDFNISRFKLTFAKELQREWDKSKQEAQRDRRKN